MKIPNGWCQCGCGNKTKIIKESCASRGWVAGTPFRFISGHGKLRHWDKYEVSTETGCWNWTGKLDRLGYAKCLQLGGRGSKTLRPMRYFYEALIGPIGPGLHLDHLCRNRRCINPWHLEPVTPAENARRGANAKLTEAMVEDIRGRLSRGIPSHVIAGIFGVSQATICDIKMGRRWV